MVRLKIISHSNWPLYTFPSQMVRLKIVSHSNHPLYRCFPRKWYAPKLFPTQIGHCIHVSLANGTPQNCFPLKSATLSMFPSQMVRLKIISHSIRPLHPCFPRKWYALKLPPTQIGHFRETISRGTICEGNMDKMDNLSGKQFWGVPFARETWTKWPIWVGNNFKVYHLRGNHR